MAAATTSAGTVLAALALLAGDASQAQPDGTYRNITAGGPLRHGVYGRIEVRGTAPPPVIYGQPMIANQATVPSRAKPVYLYVPPGQVRKWKRHCAKWSACQEAVLFVRMDDSPGRWGRWKQFREQLALQRTARD